MSLTGRLSDYMVIVARDDAPDDKFSQHLATCGARVVGLRLMRKERIVPCDALDATLNALGEFDCIAFASPAAVDFFVERCIELKIPLIGELKHHCIAAVGQRTAQALRRRGLHIHVVGDSGGAKLGELLGWQLGQALGGAEPTQPWRVLLPRAVEGREELQDGLEQQGVHVTSVEVYRSLPATDAASRFGEAMERMEQHKGRCAILLTSPKRVESFASLWSQYAKATSPKEAVQEPSPAKAQRISPMEILWVAIGETTGRAMVAHGFVPLHIAGEPTPQAVVAAIRGEGTEARKELP